MLWEDPAFRTNFGPGLSSSDRGQLLVVGSRREYRPHRLVVNPRIGGDPRNRRPGCMCGQDLFDLNGALGCRTRGDQSVGQRTRVSACPSGGHGLECGRMCSPRASCGCSAGRWCACSAVWRCRCR